MGRIKLHLQHLAGDDASKGALKKRSVSYKDNSYRSTSQPQMHHLGIPVVQIMPE